ncbi:MAG: carbon-nitrogen hydrolase family protein [Thermoplasmataceae archaeon]
MDEISVLAVQAPRMRIKDAAAYFQSAIQRTGGKEFDFILFPEKWVLDELSERSSEFQELLNIFCKYSDAYGCVVLPGSFSLLDGGKLFNTAPVIYRGSVLGFQEKISLFRSEVGKYTPGKEVRVFEGNVKFSIAVCYDIDFPYYSRIAAQKGADVILNPSLIQAKFHEMWHLYVLARSLENRIPIVSVNSLSEPFGGNSVSTILVDNGDGVMIHADRAERMEIAVFRIDVGNMRELRRKRLMEDPGTYGLLTK